MGVIVVGIAKLCHHTIINACHHTISIANCNGGYNSEITLLVLRIAMGYISEIIV